ncbi:MAG: hypothetical protein FWC19_06455 [Treponema sp.]|nr:hypothetical protein [Treponema sp.]MCL2272425.1 hypothetical protein [Treponema sp.]
MTKTKSSLVGAREANKLSVIFAEITEYEKEAKKLCVKTAKAYYNAGNILCGIIKRWKDSDKRLSAKSVAELTGYPEQRITLALKIFKHFENNPEALNSLALRDALKLIAPPPPAGEEGYNRIDLGGDPGQLQFDFGKIFELPATGNLSLKNYRTVGDRLSDIFVVHRTDDNMLTSKRIVRFFEDVPKNDELLHAYKTMSQITQAAVEDYLAALEQEEAQG